MMPAFNTALVVVVVVVSLLPTGNGRGASIFTYFLVFILFPRLTCGFLPRSRAYRYIFPWTDSLYATTMGFPDGTWQAAVGGVVLGTSATVMLATTGICVVYILGMFAIRRCAGSMIFENNHP